MDILEEARAIVYGDREKTYGDPGRNCRNIASVWSMIPVSLYPSNRCAFAWSE